MNNKQKNSDKKKIREIIGKMMRVANRLKNSGDLTHYKKALALAKKLEKKSDLAAAKKLEQEFISGLKKKYPADAKFIARDRSGYDEPDYTPPQQAADAASILYDKPHATAQCAKYVIDSINEAGKGVGIKVDGVSAHAPNTSACNMGPTLIHSGFTKAYEGNHYPPLSSDKPYTPQIGDVAVIQGDSKDARGHACMWNGTEWVSDYHQGKTLYPRSKINNEDKTQYTIYHWPPKEIKQPQPKKRSVAKAKVKDAKRKRT